MQLSREGELNRWASEHWAACDDRWIPCPPRRMVGSMHPRTNSILVASGMVMEDESFSRAKIISAQIRGKCSLVPLNTKAIGGLP